MHIPQIFTATDSQAIPWLSMLSGSSHIHHAWIFTGLTLRGQPCNFISKFGGWGTSLSPQLLPQVIISKCCNNFGIYFKCHSLKWNF